MKKRLSFAVLIAFLHLAFALAAGLASLRLTAEGRYSDTEPLVKLLFSPVYYPFQHTGNALVLFGLNSLLWGIMAERLVFGRKTVWRKKRAAI